MTCEQWRTATSCSAAPRRRNSPNPCLVAQKDNLGTPRAGSGDRPSHFGTGARSPPIASSAMVTEATDGALGALFLGLGGFGLRRHDDAPRLGRAIPATGVAGAVRNARRFCNSGSCCGPAGPSSSTARVGCHDERSTVCVFERPFLMLLKGSARPSRRSGYRGSVQPGSFTSRSAANGDSTAG